MMTRHPLWWAASQCRNPYNCQPKERGSCPRELQLKLHPVTCVWRPPTPTDTYTSLVHVWAEWNGAYMSEHVRHARICGRFQTALVRTEVSVVLYIVLYIASLHRVLLHIVILYCILHCFILYSVRGGAELRWALSYLACSIMFHQQSVSLLVCAHGRRGLSVPPSRMGLLAQGLVPAVQCGAQLYSAPPTHFF